MNKEHPSHLKLLNTHFGIILNKTIEKLIFIIRITNKAVKNTRNQALVVQYSD